MRGDNYTKDIKSRADKLRSQGKSYQYINNLLGIPKSTLSTWFSEKHANLYSRDVQLAHLARIRPMARASIARRIEKRDLLIRERAGNEIKNIRVNTSLKKLILGFLYWAEGTKSKTVSGLIFVNTDSTMMKLFVDLLRQSYKIDESKFRIRIHLHYYHEKEELTKFWSELLNIQKNHFAKPYLKPRSKKKRFRKNSKGICLLKYADSNIRREILAISQLFAENNLKFP